MSRPDSAASRSHTPGGILDQLSNQDYHRLDSLSSSGIKHLLRSPAHYQAARLNARPPSEAMRIGSAVHTLVLEPHRSSEVVQMPEFNARTKDGKAERDTWLAANAGAEAFDAAAYDRILATTRSVREHPGAQALLSDGVAERSVFWRDAEHEIDCRARMDWHRSDFGIVDLKTCQDASPEAASRAIAQFGYAISAAHYWLGHAHVYERAPAFWAFVFVETEPPHSVACYVLEPEALQFGMRQCARAYRLFAECQRTGHWPAYPDTIEPISIPRWAFKADQEGKTA